MEWISNNHLKEIAKLTKKKFRSLSENILVEGLRSIEHLNINKVKIKELYITEPLIEYTTDFNSEKTLLLKPSQFDRITTTKNPQTIAALIEKQTVQLKDSKFIIYLDDIHEPGNLGTIIRTADAAGASGIVLSPDSCDIYNPKTIRASMGSVFTFPIIHRNYLWLKEQNADLIATDIKDAVNIFEYPKPSGDIILIIGSEANGINEKIMNFVKNRVMIPLNNNTESLNAAIATGIVVYHFLHNPGYNV